MQRKAAEDTSSMVMPAKRLAERKNKAWERALLSDAKFGQFARLNGSVSVFDGFTL